MSDELRYFGYGFSRAGREAAWSDLDQGGPVKGDDCPLTLELLESVLGQPIEPGRQQALDVHLATCPYCQKRLESQERAARLLAEARAGLPEHQTLAEVGARFARRRAARCWGSVDLVKQSARAGGSECLAKLTLEPDAEPWDGPRELYLRWEQSIGDGGPLKWYLKLEVPAADAAFDVQALDGTSVGLLLCGADDSQPSPLFQTELHQAEGGRLLFSHPQRVEIEHPQHVRKVRFTLDHG